MAGDNFFGAEQPVEEVVETPVEKIKLGDKEYSQDQLQKLVGLGEIGLEAETKYKTRIDRVWPQFQSIVNEKKALEEKLQGYEAEKATNHQKELEERIKAMEGRSTQTTTPATEQPKTELPRFTPEQIKEAALKQAEDLGIGPQAMRKTVLEVIQGQQLLSEVGQVIDDMTAEGLPSATVEDILNQMQQNGFNVPEKAYKDMFEKEYLEDQTKKLAEIKSKGLPTIESSAAGGKVPTPVKITTANLEQLVKESLSGDYSQG